MTGWDQRRYEQEKQSFVAKRVNLAPLWSQFTLIFAATWGSAWFCSWFLWHFFSPTHDWARSLPLRYAIAFLFAYACFFLAARVWIEEAKREPGQQLESPDLGNAMYPADGDGCLLVIVLLVIGFIVGGFFVVGGGAPLLLEAAFEAAFAGVVVRRPILGDLVLGGWKLKLLENTWRRALLGFLALLAVAAALQTKAPQATTFAEAVRTVAK